MALKMLFPIVCIYHYRLCMVPLYLTFFMFPLQNESYFTIRDLKGSKLSGSVFNILFNLNKFMAFETRDPFLIRQVF